MWLKVIDTSFIPAVEHVIDEAFLMSCEYRRQTDGKVLIGLTRQLIPGNNDTLEAKIASFYSAQDVQFDLYSGDVVIKSVRGCPFSFYIQEREKGFVIERADFLVGGKISNTSMNASAAPVEIPPVVLGTTYNKTTGVLVVNTTHALHSPNGFIVTDFDVTKIKLGNGATFDSLEVKCDVNSTRHEHADFLLTGVCKQTMDDYCDQAGTTSLSGTPFTISFLAGWNHPISNDQLLKSLEVSL